MTRPASVTIAFWLVLVHAVLSMAGGALVMFSAYALLGNAMLAEPARAVQVLVAALAVGIGLSLVVLAVIMRRGRRWARNVLIALQVIMVGFAVASLFGDSDTLDIANATLTMALGAAIVALLLAPPSRDFFQKRE